jgi:hypothetical protein
VRMLSAFGWGLAGAALAIGIALANPGPPPGSLDVIFKNTIKITSNEGEEFVYFNPDQTFMTRGPDGDSYGRWRIVGDQICTKVKDTPESCGIIEANRAVGDHWQHQLGGETITIEIVQGR